MIIRPLREEDISLVISSVAILGWSTDLKTYEHYVLGQLKSNHPFWIMVDGEKFVGHICLKWHSEYKYFVDNNIPEIANLAIMPDYLRQGNATRLMDVAEQEAKTRSGIVGLGVGLYKDYGPAQRLYMNRGYKFDGNGMTYNTKPVIPGTSVIVDDDLLIWMIKELGHI